MHDGQTVRTSAFGDKAKAKAKAKAASAVRTRERTRADYIVRARGRAGGTRKHAVAAGVGGSVSRRASRGPGADVYRLCV